MALNLKDGILPISYVKSNAAKMMGIIKIAEKDIVGGRVRKADDVFKDLRERIVGEGK